MKRRISTLSLTVALVATACTGGDSAEQAIVDVPTTVPMARTIQEPATTTTAPEPATTTTTVLAPSTLAFSSSADIGRLFQVGEAITAATTAGGEPDATTVASGTIVQASSVRSRNDVLWVRIESTATDGSTLGWVPANVLNPTSESVFSENRELARQFRQVASVVENDALGIFANPGVGTALGFLAEGEIAMHGGVSALTASGDVWLDVIDPATSTRIGWVPARLFGTLAGGAIQDNDGNESPRSPQDGVNYGQTLAGGISATGCNAVQVTFTNASSSNGLGIVFGTDSPVGRELSTGGHRWLGTSVFGPAGSDLTITIPATSTRTWFFAPLDNNAQATFTSVDEDGLAIASNVLEISVPGGSCAVARVEPTAPTLDEYVFDLPPDQRDASIARFEAELAEFEGRSAPLIPDDDAAADGEIDPEAPGAEGEGDAEAAVDPDAATDPAAPVQDPAATNPAATDPAAPDPAAPADGTVEQPAA